MQEWWGLNFQALQITASGGVAPYSWSSVNSIAGAIDSNGLFTAHRLGITTVQVRDSLGTTASTSFIQVSAQSTAGQGNPDNTNNTPANDNSQNEGGGSTSLLFIIMLLTYSVSRRKRFVS